MKHCFQERKIEVTFQVYHKNVYTHNGFIASAALILFHTSLYKRKRNILQSKLFIYQFFMQSFYSFVEDQFELIVEATVLDDNNNIRIMIMIDRKSVV